MKNLINKVPEGIESLLSDSMVLIGQDNGFNAYYCPFGISKRGNEIWIEIQRWHRVHVFKQWLFGCLYANQAVDEQLKPRRI